MSKKRFTYISFFLISIVFLCAFSSQNVWAINESKPDDVNQLIIKARAFKRIGDYNNAILIWEKALNVLDADQKPDAYLEVVICLANAYQGVGYHQKALDLLDHALLVAEKEGEISLKALFYNSLGDICLSMRQPDISINFLEKAVRRHIQTARVILSWLYPVLSV